MRTNKEQPGPRERRPVSSGSRISASPPPHAPLIERPRHPARRKPAGATVILRSHFGDNTPPPPIRESREREPGRRGSRRPANADFPAEDGEEPAARPTRACHPGSMAAARRESLRVPFSARPDSAARPAPRAVVPGEKGGRHRGYLRCADIQDDHAARALGRPAPRRPWRVADRGDRRHSGN